HEIYEMIKTGLVDFGFLPETVSSGLTFESLLEDPLKVIVSKDHPFSTRKKLPLSALAHEPFILPEWGMNHDVENLIRSHHLKLNVRYEIKEDQTLIAMVQQGLGLSIFPSLTLRNQDYDFVAIPFEEDFKRIIGIGYATTSLSPIAKQFINMTIEWLAS
ncbi:MAG: LysR family transcriptional regulator substrate-binding protein, partial [Clostridia bacterium]|nr:LysR family transcriptional regulator substrate-binding protein [Clostridia bacterium]